MELIRIMQYSTQIELSARVNNYVVDVAERFDKWGFDGADVVVSPASAVQRGKEFFFMVTVTLRFKNFAQWRAWTQLTAPTNNVSAKIREHVSTH